MKQYVISILLILSSLVIQAQEKTIITGKLLTKSDMAIILSVLSFDTVNLIGSEDYRYKKTAGIKAQIFPDSTYLIWTDKIIHTNTACWFHVGRQLITLLLSPGDSLNMDIDYWSFKSSIEFNGIGSNKNTYNLQRQRIFYDGGRSKNISYYQGVDRMDKLLEFERDQLSLLDNFFDDGLLDSTFYDWEQRRIKYKTFSTLGVKYSREKTDSAVANRLHELYKSFDYNDEAALLTMSSYRRLISSYTGFLTQTASDDTGTTLRLRVELAQSRLNGLIRSYALWKTVDRALNGTTSQVEKDLVWAFAWNNISDERVKNLLTRPNSKVYHYSDGSKVIIQGVITTLLIIVGIILVVLGILYLSRKQKKRWRLNIMAWLKYGLLLSALVVILGVILPINNNSLWSIIGIAGVALGWAIHTLILIPRIFQKRKYLLYAILLIILCASSYIGLYFEIHFQGDFQGTNAITRIALKAWMVSVVPVILFSFLYYYVALLAKEKKTPVYLFKEKIISLEALGHLILMSFIYLSLIGSNPQAFRLFILYWVVLGIFYSNAFWLIPKYIITKKFGKAVGYSIILFSIMAVILTIIDAVFVYKSLAGTGISISWKDTPEIPRNLDLYLFVIPAIIYAFARQWIVSQRQTGYKLFRKAEAELNQLKSQVNPHFLFNSLNTVYAFALKEGNNKTAESIAKLANLMRYLIEDMEQETIPIKKEIGYIEDYIKLQLIRSSVDHKIGVNVELDEEQKNLPIAPMLMIPFVENAFKHGINPNSQSELKINISKKGNEIQFVIENSVDHNFEAFYKEKGFGIGIKNVRKRLEFIYPGKHSLSIADTDDRFIVIMEIEL